MIAKQFQRRFSAQADFFPYSTVKVISKSGKTENLKQPESRETLEKKPNDESSQKFRVNEVNIQMISESLYKQIFGDRKNFKIADPEMVERWDQNKIENISIPTIFLYFRNKRELFRHGIKLGEDAKVPEVDLKLPPLRGKNIEEHFYEIAKEQVGSYESLILSLVSSQIPDMPKVRQPLTIWIQKTYIKLLF